MKIVHISDGDGEGQSAGAQIIMNRLHRELEKIGVESTILCANKTEGFDGSVRIERSFFEKAVESLIGKVTIPLGLNEIRNLSSFKIPRMREFAEADLVHLHTIHSGFFSYLALPYLTRKKPTVFTIHDMWAYTGHCTASLDCQRWESGCGHCPYPEVYPPIARDNTRLEWRLKNRLYDRAKLTIVSVSSHQTGEIRRSMLGRFPSHEIPHGIDTGIFRPLDVEPCREALGIPADRRTILVGATHIDRPGKGSNLLLEALRKLPAPLRENTTLLTFGHGGQAFSEAADMPSVNLGYIDHGKLPEVYSAADMFVFPSRKETFGLVLLESMACGTPVVSFNVGAAPELVRPDQTGWLAEAQTSDALCRGMVHLLEHDALRKEMGTRCRALVLAEYSVSVQARKYHELYQRILMEHTP